MTVSFVSLHPSTSFRSGRARVREENSVAEPHLLLPSVYVFLLLEGNSRGRNDRRPVACRCSFPLLFCSESLSVAPCWIGRVGRQSRPPLYGFNMQEPCWKGGSKITPGFNFLKYVHVVCLRLLIKDFTVVTLPNTASHMHIPTISATSIQ